MAKLKLCAMSTGYHTSLRQQTMMRTLRWVTSTHKIAYGNWKFNGELGLVD